MWFGTLIFKNVIRRPMRSFLTVVAMAIAIGAVVSLVGVASGFEQSFISLYEKVGVDMIVVRASGDRKLQGVLPGVLRDEIAKVDGVKEIIPGLVDVISLPAFGLNMVVANGWEPETVAFAHLKVIDGRLLTRDDGAVVVIGTTFAKNTGLKVGDTFEIISREPVQVVGIYESFAVYDNGAIVAPLKELQRIFDRQGQVTGLSLVLTPEGKKRMPEIRAEVEKIAANQKPTVGVQALAIRDHLNTLTELKVAKAMAWLTSSIALVIGLFGMMNTMVMSVHERTREIGILRAVGWRPWRVMRLVLFEAVALSQLGALTGIVGSALILAALTRFPIVNGLIEGKLDLALAGYGFLIAGAVGLVGGILPARRAARLMPTAALRQE